MRYVIIGNSAAAIGCVEGIRQRDKEGEITMISREGPFPYSRPLISYLLCGKTDRERMKYRPDSWYEENRCKLLSGVEALAIDPAAKTVALSDGSTVPYDKLLAATGSIPLVPPIPGLDQVSRKFTFLSLEDALALEDALTPESRVLIMGAGLIGLKCAEGIKGRCGSITVVDMAGRVLPSVLDEEGAALVEDHLRSRGLRFILGDSAVSFGPSHARLQSGAEVSFDILVVAVGVRPNTALLSRAGAELGPRGGAVTDLFGRTTICDVYAAGDCAQSHDIVHGDDRVLALLPGAYMQGESAGLHMAGAEKPYDKAIPMNAVGFFGLHILTAGSYDGEALVESGGGNYKKLVTRDNRLMGYILIGDVARGGIYTALIRERTPLSDIDFGLIAQKPQLIAFSRRERARQLGGKHE